MTLFHNSKAVGNLLPLVIFCYLVSVCMQTLESRIITTAIVRRLLFCFCIVLIKKTWFPPAKRFSALNQVTRRVNLWGSLLDGNYRLNGTKFEKKAVKCLCSHIKDVRTLFLSEIYLFGSLWYNLHSLGCLKGAKNSLSKKKKSHVFMDPHFKYG